jgi:hypothetical protein
MRRFLLLLLSTAIMGGAEAQSLAPAPGTSESVIFDSRRDACDSSDLPDAPARALRNKAGDIVLFVPSFKARAFTGPSLGKLRKDCTIRFAAGGKADPALLDDRSWLHAFLTLPDGTIMALASASYIPYRHGLACEAGKARTTCWQNGISILKSTDDGKSFAYWGTPPGHMLLRPPHPFDNRVRNPAGYITVTNLVRWKGSVYGLAWFRAERASDSRNCLIKADEANPMVWSIWTRDGFKEAARFDGKKWVTTDESCAAIGKGVLENVRGLVLNEASGTFIALYSRAAKKGDDAGFYVSTSHDLKSWSPGRLLYAGSGPTRADLDDPGHREAAITYPALIDGSSKDPDFGTVSDRFDLIFVRLGKDASGGRVRPFRQIVRVPLLFSPGG